MRTLFVEHEVKKFGEDDISVNDYIEYKDEIYKFLGYEYGTYPVAENIKTKETITLPHY